MAVTRRLTPGTAEHRVAMELLFLLQDALALLVSVEALVARRTG